MPKIRQRLDEWLVAQNLAPSIETANQIIRLGYVRKKGSGEVLDKPGFSVTPSLEVEILIPQASRYVSRGGDKLEGFLTEAGLIGKDESSFRDKIILDVGSSTGGFSDCLLHHGARKVFAVDVGRGQMHSRLREDSRLVLFEETDIRKLDWNQISDEPDWVVVDVSFISLRQILPALLKKLSRAKWILLFKPQFEVSRFVPKKRGIAPAPESKKELDEMLRFLRLLGLNVDMVKSSSVTGRKGNQEVFIMAEPGIIPRHIFRSYDIRGHADNELPNELMERIGRAFGKRLNALGKGALKLGLGRDARVSSPRIHESLAQGLKAEGIQIFDLGEVTTPMAYFAHYNLDIDALIQVTASHNPKDDNGMKMMVLKSTLFGDEIVSLADEIQAIEPVDRKLSSSQLWSGSLASELRESYLKYLFSQFQFSKKYRIALDCGNGMAGAVARVVFEKYASELEILYEKVDCSFPNHEADPTVLANLKDLQKLVVEKKFDIGFAYDGDADRVGVITKKGRVLWGDEILMLLSELVLKERPGSAIIGEVKCSEKLFRMIEERGGKPVMYRTGHSLIKKRMKELKAPLAGEMSGHLFFADRYFGFDDAIYASLRVIEVMDKLQLDLDEWVSKHPQSVVTPELRVPCQEQEKAELVERVKKHFEKQKDARLYLIDGVRVAFPDLAWALVRASNTQAVLVVRIEANSKARVLEIHQQLSRALGREFMNPFVNDNA